MEESAIDWTFRPASLEGVHDAFAVVVTGDSMEPKYAPGDIAYVNPAKQPRKGCFVLVELMGHRGLVKQFDRWDGDTLFLQQFNPACELRFERAEVLRLLPIIGSMDA
jgi:phage repressor protein C with HTH and peptisase S24 domain